MYYMGTWILWVASDPQVEIKMSDGTCFAMTDARRFGRIRLGSNPDMASRTTYDYRFRV